MARAGHQAGWTAEEIPMSDGGEGLLDVVGGELRQAEVHGPLGAPIEAQWRWRADDAVAVIEMAGAAGLLLAGGAAGNDPIAASTRGVGELIMAAVAAGAQRIVVGCGGSATTDGGDGVIETVGSPERLRGATLIAATDVTTAFRDAAGIFGPQKGATPEQVGMLADRLDQLASRYRERFGVDVTVLPGAGAAGGLAGGLAALGGTIEPGFSLVAGLVGLPERVRRADLVVTGEGKLDATSFAGKVVGGLLEQVAGKLPVLCIAGDVAPGVTPPGNLEVISLVERAGPERARTETVALIEEAVAGHLLGWPLAVDA